jgi:hypothetical protein
MSRSSAAAVCRAQSAGFEAAVEQIGDIAAVGRERAKVGCRKPDVMRHAGHVIWVEGIETGKVLPHDRVPAPPFGKRRDDVRDDRQFRVLRLHRILLLDLMQARGARSWRALIYVNSSIRRAATLADTSRGRLANRVVLNSHRPRR